MTETITDLALERRLRELKNEIDELRAAQQRHLGFIRAVLSAVEAQDAILDVLREKLEAK